VVESAHEVQLGCETAVLLFPQSTVLEVELVRQLPAVQLGHIELVCNTVALIQLFEVVQLPPHWLLLVQKNESMLGVEVVVVLGVEVVVVLGVGVVVVLGDELGLLPSHPIVNPPPPSSPPAATTSTMFCVSILPPPPPEVVPPPHPLPE